MKPFSKLFVILLVIFVTACNADKKEAPAEDQSGINPAAKELFDCAKNAYETALKEKKQIPINEVIQCREKVEKKYAEQLKDEKFRKEFETQVEGYKKDLEAIIDQFDMETINSNQPVKIEMKGNNEAKKGENTENKK